ncbi:Zinc finger RNA-binding protein, partial [Mucuna pruriens]
MSMFSTYLLKPRILSPLIKGSTNIESLKSSSAAFHPEPFPGSSSKNFSSLSGTKRKEPSTRSSHQQPFHESFNGEAKTDDIHCKICQISCSSPSNLKQHLKGHKHRQTVQKGRSNQTQWCEVCSVLCMNEDLLKLHFQGQKHKAKLQMLKINKEYGEAPNKPRWCELCKVWCSDEFSFKQHLEGKKHIVQLHVMEKEKER